MMLSGSEDCTARLWDLVTGKALRCIKAFGTNEVNSVCFSPTANLICAAAGNEISLFDLRQQAVILRKASQVCSSTDEINEICFNEKGTFLAAADDSGEVKVFDVKQQQPTVFKTLRGHKNLCSSVAFHPKLPWELFTGGFDCRLLSWDFSKARHTALFDPSTQEAKSAQSINPPFIHNISVSPSAQWLAAGLGNANVLLHRFSDGSTRELEGHTNAVSQVQFLDDSRLLSAANDNLVMVWDVSSIPPPVEAPKPRKGKQKASSKKDNNATHTDNAATEEEQAPLQAKISVEHSTKINWVRGRASEKELTFFVADMSPHISAYRLLD